MLSALSVFLEKKALNLDVAPTRTVLPELTPFLFGIVLFLIGLLFLPGERAASRAQKEEEARRKQAKTV